MCAKKNRNGKKTFLYIFYLYVLTFNHGYALMFYNLIKKKETHKNEYISNQI
jgi:hypothetical protein